MFDNNQQSQKNIKNLDKIFSAEAIGKTQEITTQIIRTDNFKRALEWFRLFERILQKYKKEFQVNKEAASFYEKIIVKCKFIAFPLLRDEEAIALIRDYFTWQFRIPDYDLLAKLKYKIINIPLFEAQDEFREKLKKAILASDLHITKNSKVRSIKKWLIDYSSRLGLKVDNLKRRQYLTDLEKNKDLNKHEIHKLTVLFNFYEKLKLSTFEPSGFEQDVFMTAKNGKNYIFKQGILEAIKDRGKDFTRYKEIIKKLYPKKAQLEELQKMLANYQEDSIEYKAIEDEIEKLQNKGKKKTSKTIPEPVSNDSERQKPKGESEKSQNSERILSETQAESKEKRGDDQEGKMQKKQELQKMLQQYKPNSMEYKAIMDELDNL